MKQHSHLIVHIPHSSTVIPTEYRHIYVHPEKLDENILGLTDLYTDELFANRGATIVFPLSRLVCDVERFRQKELESMTKLGMWICYTRTPEKEPLAVFDQAHEERILTTYYDVHHQKLTETVRQALDATGHALIIDGHSFPEHLDYYPAGPCPDMCIGSDPYHTPRYLVAACREFLESRGYSVAENHPFSGSLVPMDYYQQDRRVQSIMLEVNRRVYCKKDGRKSERFSAVQRDLQELLAYLEMLTNLK